MNIDVSKIIENKLNALEAEGVIRKKIEDAVEKSITAAITSELESWSFREGMIVAIEELSECQKEICKILRGGENFSHLAEEIADATIMLEQLRLIFNINDDVNECMDAKVRRLEERLGGTQK